MSTPSTPQLAGKVVVVAVGIVNFASTAAVGPSRIRVIAIWPGIITTPMFEALPRERSKVLGMTPDELLATYTDAHPLACADSAFPRLTHAGSLAVIRDLGIGAVDIRVFAGYDHNPPDVVAADPARAAKTVGARVSEHGLEISDVFGILATTFEERAVNHPDAEVRAESLRLFEGVDPDTSLALAAAELQRRAEIAGERLLEQTDDVGITLDLSHVRQGREGVIQARGGRGPDQLPGTARSAARVRIRGVLRDRIPVRGRRFPGRLHPGGLHLGNRGCPRSDARLSCRHAPPSLTPAAASL